MTEVQLISIIANDDAMRIYSLIWRLLYTHYMLSFEREKSSFFDGIFRTDKLNSIDIIMFTSLVQVYLNSYFGFCDGIKLKEHHRYEYSSLQD